MQGLLYFFAGFFEFMGIILSLPAVICNTISNYLYSTSGLDNYNEDNMDNDGQV